MSRSSIESKIVGLENKLKAENERGRDLSGSFSVPRPGSTRKHIPLGEFKPDGTPLRPRKPLDLPFNKPIPKTDPTETENKLREIHKMQGKLKINGVHYTSTQTDLEDLGELGNGTCGHVVKMLHKPSRAIIAVKQMRRSGNADETKRILMDLEVVLKSHDCPYIVQCLGCFITDADVWICMELMATCFDKLLKRLNQPIPEDILGKVTVSTVNALSYLKVKHGVIHRDVKPSNILLDERGRIKLCDFGISGRLVDSKAKTRSAGCAAYMAPERIDLSLADYDIRADVWSLGITLVELAMGQFPYLGCNTDFEVLTRVLEEDPPSLSEHGGFSPEFQNFVKCCLTKNYKQRPKYDELLKHPFVVQYTDRNVNVAEWYGRTVAQVDRLSTQRRFGTPPASPKHIARRHFTFRNSTTEPKNQIISRHYDTLPKHNGSSSPSTLLYGGETRNGITSVPNNLLNRENSLKTYSNTTAAYNTSYNTVNTTSDVFNHPLKHSEVTSSAHSKFSSPTLPRNYNVGGYGTPSFNSGSLSDNGFASPKTSYHDPYLNDFRNSPVLQRKYGAEGYSNNMPGSTYPNSPNNHTGYLESGNTSYASSGSPNLPPRVFKSSANGSLSHEERLRRSNISPFLPRRNYESPSSELEGFWQVAQGSPSANRKRIQAYPESYHTQHSPRAGLSGNTSPIVLERFYHQQNQRRSSRSPPVMRREDPPLEQAQEAQEGWLDSLTGAVKRRFASCIKVQLSRNHHPHQASPSANQVMLGNSSPVHGTRLVSAPLIPGQPNRIQENLYDSRRRHQSPDPPPRLNRDNPNSPLAIHRSYLERLSSSPQSPSLQRRYLSTPQPPPRRLSETSALSSSPKVLHTRQHYTPEPSRRHYSPESS